MVNKCVIHTCNTIKTGDGVTLHRLPADPIARGLWFRAMLNKTGQTVFREEDEICSKHFTPQDFNIVDGVSVLRADAVPFTSMDAEEEALPSPKRAKRDATASSECSVFSCSNASKETELSRPNLIYYLFPKDKTLRASWKQFCNKTDDNFSYSFVCSDHFTSKDFVSDSSSAGNTRALKSKAVPSIYKAEIKYEDLIEEGETGITSQNAMELDYAGGENSVPFVAEDRICAIENCDSKSGGRSNIEYYPMPTHASHCKVWIQMIQKHTKQKDVPLNAFICSEHFASECFRTDAKSQKSVLIAEAVPSIFGTQIKVKNEFPVLSQMDLGDPEAVKAFYDWCLNNNQEQEKYIKFLKERYSIQSKRIARLAKSVDDFKAKKAVSEEANAALQTLFDKIIDTQYDVL